MKGALMGSMRLKMPTSTQEFYPCGSVKEVCSLKMPTSTQDNTPVELHSVIDQPPGPWQGREYSDTIQKRKEEEQTNATENNMQEEAVIIQ